MSTPAILHLLDRLEEPKSLLTLRERVIQRLPLMQLPEVVLVMHAQTNFASAFTHVSDGNARAESLSLSICAVLIAEACNIGLTPVVSPGNPALTYDRLTWVQQNYIRAETLSRANAMLVDAQDKLTLAHAWGGGEVVSADGLRFLVPVQTINAGYNSKYFGVGRGVTYYNFISDQFSGFNAIVIPGTVRDSLYILEGLLEQQTSLNPLEIMADTAGTSDLVFGLFWLLGYQFSPRIADIGEARFWPNFDPIESRGRTPCGGSCDFSWTARRASPTVSGRTRGSIGGIRAGPQCSSSLNTTYMQDALEDVRRAGKDVLDSDVARLSPLVSQHINFSGTYHFNLPESLFTGQHRPLQTPYRLDEEL